MTMPSAAWPYMLLMWRSLTSLTGAILDAEKESLSQIDEIRLVSLIGWFHACCQQSLGFFGEFPKGPLASSSQLIGDNESPLTDAGDAATWESGIANHE
jgi:hypothetical protein